VRFEIPPSIKTGVRRWAPLAMLIVGAVLLVYVTFEYGSMFYQQRQLSAQWERQNAPSSAAPPKAEDPRDQVTRLSIPNIDLDAIVVEGTSRRQLAIAPGHMTETPAPGENGNSVITGHRDTFFRHIYELKKGDEIVVRRGGKAFQYLVERKFVVQPTDVGVLRPTSDARLTLITCYPTYYVGPAPERLVVTAKLANPAATTATAAPAKSGSE
jgi:LPXTG-site transpeptidase (sortase) family protein